MAAATAAVAIVCATVAVWPYLTIQDPVMRPFVPIFATTVTLSEGLTAFLLWIQYRASRRFYFAAVASAYAFTSVTAAFHLAAFPGVFASESDPAERQAAIWLWMLWRAGFALLVTLSLATRTRPPIQNERKRFSYGLLTIGGAILLSVLLCWAAIVARHQLPNLVESGGSYRHLTASRVVLSVAGVCCLALGIHAAVTRLRTLMDLWLAVALFAGLTDVVLTLGAGARYSLGWYAARVASMASAGAMLGMLMYETSRTYSKLADAHRALKEISVRDGLTGVFNRAYFDERYPHELSQASASGSALTVLLVDVDHFKAYNDAFGHLAGDECLRRIAHALTKALMRPGDFVSRYGGEEFVVVLPGCDALSGLAAGERLRNAVAQMAIVGPAPGIPVSVSIGHASSHALADFRPAVLLANADAALYRAKMLGRNRVENEAAVESRESHSSEIIGVAVNA